MNFAFVILHYKTLEDTIECTDSIIQLDDPSVKIFIVDNFSNNGSAEVLFEKYKNYGNIEIINNTHNLGFAKGNNIGISAARASGCDFVCVLNNDTVIKQKDFTSKCIMLWENHGFSIAGPKIVSLVDGLDQNPFIVESHFVKSKKDAIKMYLVGLVKYMCVLLKVPRWWEKNKERLSYTGNLENQMICMNEKDILLYGACMIFSPTYFKEYDKMCDLTFMYEEETILYFLCRELNIKAMYLPDIQIFHKEQSSTKSTLGLGRKKLLFGYKEDFKSRKQLLKIVLKKDNKDYLKNLLKNS